MIADQRVRLSSYTRSTPRRWIGSIRRRTFARAIQGSNSIEGYNASIEDAMNAIDNEPPLDDKTETWLAINGYRQAMTYILQAVRDPHFQFSKQFLKSLHFMMISHDMQKNPGQWRPGAIFVVNSETGDAVYNAPDVELVDGLMDELVRAVQDDTTSDSLVKAAMVHLNLTLIHPFSDGNGRMARATQTLLLALDGFIHPVFSSIEEWLGRNTLAYYAALTKVAAGQWSPQRLAHSWVQFCLIAHYQQAITLLRRMDEYAALYQKIDVFADRHKLAGRMKIPIFDAALGRGLTSSLYQKEADVSAHTAARDLKKLCDVGLLVAVGEKRARRYLPSDYLKNSRDAVRIKRALRDPYEIIKQRQEPQLPF